MLSRGLIVWLLACAAAFGQGATNKSGKSTAKAQSRRGYSVGGLLIIKDEGCAKDAARAMVVQGLEERKILSSMIDYGCARLTREDLIYVVLVGENSKPVTISGYTFVNAIVMLDVELTKKLHSGRLPDFKSGEDDFLQGWIFESKVNGLTAQDVGAAIDRSRHHSESEGVDIKCTPEEIAAHNKAHPEQHWEDGISFMESRGDEKLAGRASCRDE